MSAKYNLVSFNYRTMSAKYSPVGFVTALVSRTFLPKYTAEFATPVYVNILCNKCLPINSV